MALEREKNKLIIEKCQSILTQLLKDEDNKYCVDCDAKSPRWASWNIGIFLCIRCAGIHRKLGVHISRVKSVNLDTWTPQQVACIEQMGNSRARAVYEANLEDNFRRPQTDSSLEQFIRAKYESKKHIAKEWVPPSLPNPKWDLEIEAQLRKKKEKKSSSGTIEFPAPIKDFKSSRTSPVAPSKSQGGNNGLLKDAKSRLGNSLKSRSKKTEMPDKGIKNSGIIDLLGLEIPTDKNGSTNGASTETDKDIFGDFLTAPKPPIPPNSEVDTKEPETEAKDKNDESNFFNQKAPDAGPEKLSKDSILALYNKVPPSQAQPTTQQQFVQQPYATSGMFVGANVVPGGPMGAVNPQQQQAMMRMQQVQQVQIGSGMQNAFYGGQVPSMGVPMYGQGAPCGVPGGIQLSAANPFAQMQTQMGNLNMGHMPLGQKTPFIPNQIPSGFNNGYNPCPSKGLYPDPLQANAALATNIWQ